jgi:hypothetical protein
MTKIQKKLWTGLLIMALLSPLGMLLPEILNSGDAWGEWGADTLEKLLGYVPEGLKKYTDVWKAPVPDYNPGGENTSMAIRVISYAVSGIIGILAVVMVIYAISKILVKNEK